jgi:hypothetical protein
MTFGSLPYFKSSLQKREPEPEEGVELLVHHVEGKYAQVGVFTASSADTVSE